MTVTDPAHVATAKLLREEFCQPATRPTHEAVPDTLEGLVRDLTDYDLAFGLTDLTDDGRVT